MYTDKELKKMAKNLDDSDLAYLISEYMDINDLKEIKGIAESKKSIVKLKAKRYKN